MKNHKIFDRVFFSWYCKKTFQLFTCREREGTQFPVLYCVILLCVGFPRVGGSFLFRKKHMILEFLRLFRSFSHWDHRPISNSDLPQIHIMVKIPKIQSCQNVWLSSMLKGHPRIAPLGESSYRTSKIPDSPRGAFWRCPYNMVEFSAKKRRGSVIHLGMIGGQNEEYRIFGIFIFEWI